MIETIRSLKGKNKTAILKDVSDGIGKMSLSFSISEFFNTLTDVDIIAAIVITPAQVAIAYAPGKGANGIILHKELFDHLREKLNINVWYSPQILIRCNRGENSFILNTARDGVRVKKGFSKYDYVTEDMRVVYSYLKQVASEQTIRNFNYILPEITHEVQGDNPNWIDENEVIVGMPIKDFIKKIDNERKTGNTEDAREILESAFKRNREVQNQLEQNRKQPKVKADTQPDDQEPQN